MEAKQYKFETGPRMARPRLLSQLASSSLSFEECLSVISIYFDRGYRAATTYIDSVKGGLY